jgi:hypothetical protein
VSSSERSRFPAAPIRVIRATHPAACCFSSSAAEYMIIKESTYRSLNK